MDHVMGVLFADYVSRQAMLPMLQQVPHAKKATRPHGFRSAMRILLNEGEKAKCRPKGLIGETVDGTW